MKNNVINYILIGIIGIISIISLVFTFVNKSDITKLKETDTQFLDLFSKQGEINDSQNQLNESIINYITR